MEDYTQLTRRSSDDGALSDVGGDGGPLSATSKRKVSPPLSWERSASVHAPLAPFAAAPAAATTKKNISFSDRIPEEEDEDDDDEEDDDIGEELRRKLGKQLLCTEWVCTEWVFMRWLRWEPWGRREVRFSAII